MCIGQLKTFTTLCVSVNVSRWIHKRGICEQWGSTYFHLLLTHGSAPAYQGREQTTGWKWYLGNSSCHDGCDRHLRPVCPWLIGTSHFFTCGFVLHVGGEKRSKKQTKRDFFFFKLLRLKEYYFGQTSVTERFHLRGLCWLQVWTVPPMRLWKQKWNWEIQPSDLHSHHSMVSKCSLTSVIRDQLMEQ